MSEYKSHIDAVKRTIRNLKKSEIRIRFSQNSTDFSKNSSLIWDVFFDLKEPYIKGAKYTLDKLCRMNKVDFKRVVEEFYWNVYYRLFKDSYYGKKQAYEINALSKLGLPPLANMDDIKKRFRELAKKYHPDMGGSREEFIELYKIYDELKSQ